MDMSNTHTTYPVNIMEPKALSLVWTYCSNIAFSMIVRNIIEFQLKVAVKFRTSLNGEIKMNNYDKYIQVLSTEWQYSNCHIRNKYNAGFQASPNTLKAQFLLADFPLTGQQPMSRNLNHSQSNRPTSRRQHSSMMYNIEA
jgi:hypothetical protein